MLPRRGGVATRTDRDRGCADVRGGHRRRRSGAGAAKSSGGDREWERSRHHTRIVRPRSDRRQYRRAMARIHPRGPRLCGRSLSVLRRVAAVVLVAGVSVGLGLPMLRAARASNLAGPHAVKLVTAGGKRLAGEWQGWANASLVPTVTGKVVINLTGCPELPNAAGCVYTKNPRVIYLKRGLAHPRGVMLHELGHVYDLTGDERQRPRPVPAHHAPAARAVVEGQDPARRVVRRGVLVVRALLEDRLRRRATRSTATTRRRRSTRRPAR